MSSSVFLGEARRVLVAEDAEQKSDEVPDADEYAVVAPVAGLRDQLGVYHRWTEWEDRDHHQTNILGAVFDRHDFTRTGQCDKLVQACTETREDASS